MVVGKLPCWSELLVAGNFNADLTSPEGEERDKEVFSGSISGSTGGYFGGLSYIHMPLEPRKRGVEHVVDKVRTYTDGQRTYTDGQISKPATLDRLDSV